MTISDIDAQFRASEKILKHQMVFVSHDVLTPLTRDPLKDYGGADPAAYGALILTNERILFLFDPTPYTGDHKKDMRKAIGKGVAIGAVKGVAAGLTHGVSDKLGKVVSWERGRFKKEKIDFTIYKDAKSSVSIPLEKIKGYKKNFRHWQTTFTFKYPFNESYLSLNYQDNTGSDHWICMYCNIIGENKAINTNKWLKAILKVKTIPESNVQSFSKSTQVPSTVLPETHSVKTTIIQTNQNGMMTCPNCGKVQLQAKFCGDCGKEVPQEQVVAAVSTQNMTTEATTVTTVGKPISEVTISQTPNEVPEEPYIETTQRLDRFTKVLTDENVREDIMKGDYNIEAGITWVVFILLYEFIVSIIIGEGYPFSTFQDIFIPTTLAILFQLFVILGLTYVAGLILQTNITFSEIFRIYTYTFLVPLIVSAIFFGFSGIYFIWTANFYLLFGISNIIGTLIEVLIMAIGYKTLFKTDYIKALGIMVIVIAVSIFPVFFLDGLSRTIAFIFY